MADPLKLDAWSPGWVDRPLLDDDVAPWEQDAEVDAEFDDAAVGAARAAACRARLADIIELLSPHDKALLKLTEMGVNQTTIGAVLGKAQSTISYSTRRLMGRLKVLAARPVIDADDMATYLLRHMSAIEAKILQLMLVDPCHASIAKKLNIGSAGVRLRCARSVATLKALAADREADELESQVYRTFRAIVVNATLLHPQTRTVPQLTFHERREPEQLELRFAS